MSDNLNYISSFLFFWTNIFYHQLNDTYVRSFIRFLVRRHAWFFKIIINSDLCSFSLSVHFFYFVIRCDPFSQSEGSRKFIDQWPWPKTPQVVRIKILIDNKSCENRECFSRRGGGGSDCNLSLPEVEGDPRNNFGVLWYILKKFEFCMGRTHLTPSPSRSAHEN